jgi:hypothetical protein
MFISAARRKLQAAIDAATDPLVVAQLATALSRLMDAEGRARGRRRREKECAAKAKEKQSRVVDLDCEFSLDDEPNLTRPISMRE